MSIQQLGQKVWYDVEGTGYIMLDVTDNIAPLEEIKIDGQRLLPKPEYLCSLLAARKVVNDKVSETQLVELVRKFLVNRIIRFESLIGDLYVCRKKGELTVISGANISGLDDLRQEIKKLIPDYAPIFPHVTLLKSENSQYGIGINSQADLDSFCEKITS